MSTLNYAADYCASEETAQHTLDVEVEQSEDKGQEVEVISIQQCVARKLAEAPRLSCFLIFLRVVPELFSHFYE